ncbi:hypothetical protein P3S68_027212 [Capsicum galapagoense]
MSLGLADEHLADSCNICQMLTTESPLPKAKEPGFFTERNLFDEAKSGSQTAVQKMNSQSHC